MERLTRLERKIIKIGLSKNTFSYDDLKKLESKFSQIRITQCLISMNDRGYFSSCEFCDDIPVRISLSDKALSFSERNRIDKIEFFKRSILCPIIVSFITTVIVLAIKSLL